MIGSIELLCETFAETFATQNTREESVDNDDVPAACLYLSKAFDSISPEFSFEKI